MEAPWREVSFGESSDEDVEVGSSLYQGELAPKRLRDEISGQGGRSKQQQKGGNRRQIGAGGRRIGDSKWCMPEFSVDLGGATLVAVRYIVKSVQSQVILQDPDPAGREIWLGVDLRTGRRRTKTTGWVQTQSRNLPTEFFSLHISPHGVRLERCGLLYQARTG